MPRFPFSYSVGNSCAGIEIIGNGGPKRINDSKGTGKNNGINSKRTRILLGMNLGMRSPDTWTNPALCLPDCKSPLTESFSGL